MKRARVTPEPVEKTFISAESLLRDSIELGLKVVRSGFRPSFLVGVWRGGAPIGIAVQEILEYNGIECDHIAIRTSSYFGLDQQAKTVRVHALDYLVSVLNAARDDGDGDGLTEQEMIITLILVFAAGFETTTNLIGNGLLALLRNPAELARLRTDPDLVATAIEEILRFESPVQVDARRAREDAEVGGVAVPAGDWVTTFIGAANRDPAVFDQPDAFRIVERDTPVLSFASGIHYCLGASLARLEGQVVFGRLLERFASIEWLDDEPAWRNTLILRGLTELNVRVR